MEAEGPSQSPAAISSWATTATTLYDGRKFGTVRLEEHRPCMDPAGLPLLVLGLDRQLARTLLNPLTWWENLTGKMRWNRMGRFRRVSPRLDSQ